MSEHQSETASLRQINLPDDTDERDQLEKSIAQVQRDARCVRRVAAVTTLFPALTAAGLAYGAILQKDFPHIGSPFVTKVLCELGVASLICLVVFMGLLTAYRMKLHRLRKEYRRSATRPLNSHLGQPRLAALRGSPLEHGDRGVARGAVEVSHG